MNFSKLNPWRNTPTIYKWDDNWRPEIGRLTSPLITKQYTWVCPPTFYAELVSFGFTWYDIGGAGNTSFNVSQLRGSQLIYKICKTCRSQNVNGEELIFCQGFVRFVGLLAGALVHSIGAKLHFIPGDRLVVDIDSTKIQPQLKDSYINLKAYYF